MRSARDHVPGTAARLAGIALLALLAGGAAVGASATARGSHASSTLSPGGRSAFVPAVGDWEGTLGGLHASFELLRYPHGQAYGASAFAVRDLVYQRPATCPASLTDPNLSTFVAYADSPPPYVLVSSDGRFPFDARPLYGSITGPAHAAVDEAFTVGRPGSRTGCSGHLRFALAPAHRVPVADGTWRLTAQDGSGATFTVRGAGRIAYAIPLSSIVAHCSNGTTPGSFSGELALFIHPNGTAGGATSGNGALMAVSLRFTGPASATGQYLAGAAGCSSTTLAFSATRVSAGDAAEAVSTSATRARCRRACRRRRRG